MAKPPTPAGDAGTESARAAFWAGHRATWPLLVGVVPFGLVFGATTIEAGFTTADAGFASVVVLAGASQIALVDLLGDGGSMAVAVGTALVINLRMLLYSASLAPWLAHESGRRRFGLAYALTDQAFAVSVARYDAGLPQNLRLPYYLGSATALWGAWQPSTIVGALVGDRLPEQIPLDVAVPLVFLVLVIPAIRDRANLVAAFVGGTVAVVLGGLPANAGLFAGAVSGITAGWVVASSSGTGGPPAVR